MQQVSRLSHGVTNNSVNNVMLACEIDSKAYQHLLFCAVNASLSLLTMRSIAAAAAAAAC